MNKPDEGMPDLIDAKESDYLYLKTSAILNAGMGLFTAIRIYKNERISLFKGEILSNREAAIRVKNKTDGYFINMPDGTIMDSREVKCFAKYANDAEGFKKNRSKNNSIIALDQQDKVCLIATRTISSGEEIFCGYGKEYWKKFLS
ncbi:MAG: hypothetical protein JWP12_910 [Bacteroidetes bacterium]|nr:hypothetical protein [Bacteroidota bacterium]